MNEDLRKELLKAKGTIKIEKTIYEGTKYELDRKRIEVESLEVYQEYLNAIKYEKIAKERLEKYEEDYLKLCAKVKEKCNHELCYDEGYYKVEWSKGKEKETITYKEKADVRKCTCIECGIQLRCFQFDNDNWDNLIFNPKNNQYAETEILEISDVYSLDEVRDIYKESLKKNSTPEAIKILKKSVGI